MFESFTDDNLSQEAPQHVIYASSEAEAIELRQKHPDSNVTVVSDTAEQDN